MAAKSQAELADKGAATKSETSLNGNGQQSTDLWSNNYTHVLFHLKATIEKMKQNMYVYEGRPYSVMMLCDSYFKVIKVTAVLITITQWEYYNINVTLL